jgi:hypothetical protein
VDIYENTLNKWRLNPKGIVIYDNEDLSIYRLALLLCSKVLNKKSNSSILITVPTEASIDKLAFEVTQGNTFNKVFESPLHIISVTNKNYIPTNVDLLIVIKPDKYVIDGIRQFPKWFADITYKYLLFVSDRYEAYEILKPDIQLIENISKFNVPLKANSNIQYNYEVMLSAKDKSLYDEYSGFISDTIAMIGSLDLIYEFVSEHGLTKREYFAASKGWHRDLDLNLPFEAELHRYFSPKSLYDRCSTFMEITTKRNKLIQDNAAKLEVIFNIIAANPKKKIAIVSKNSPRALEICTSINRKFKSEFVPFVFADAIEQHLLQGICVNFNNNLDSIYIDGVNTKKGDKKPIGSTVQNKHCNDYYNENKARVVSCSNSVPSYANFNFDILIFTSPSCNTLLDIRTKVDSFKLASNGIVIYLFCPETKEFNEMDKINFLAKGEIKSVKSVGELNN